MAGGRGRGAEGEREEGGREEREEGGGKGEGGSLWREGLE